MYSTVYKVCHIFHFIYIFLIHYSLDNQTVLQTCKHCPTLTMFLRRLAGYWFLAAS